MATNLFVNQIRAKLVDADPDDENIRISYSVKSAADFRNGTVENKNSQLIKSIFHKPAAEPHILLNSSGRSRHVHHKTA